MIDKDNRLYAQEIKDARQLQKLLIAWFWNIVIICGVMLACAWTLRNIIYMFEN